MQPDAVAEFVSAFSATENARNSEAERRHRARCKALADVERKLEGSMDAIADGFRTPGLLQKLEEAEARKDELTTELAAPAPPPIRLHPKLAELYRAKVADLVDSLRDPTIKPQALDILRGLIERVSVRSSRHDGRTVLELEGAITAMIDASQPERLGASDRGSVEVVAGARLGLHRTLACLSFTHHRVSNCRTK